jgi:hypothetical protein
MIPILDFQERSLRGPVMKSTDFDLGFSQKLWDLVSGYDIRRDPEELIVDEKTADVVFEAGVDLLADVGLYHLDTQRVVQFSREEILQVAREHRESPPEPTFGRGEDRISVKYRTSEEERPPILAAGPAGTSEQEWFAPFVRSFVEEPSNKALGIAGGLASVNGRTPKVGTLNEMYCAQWECEQLVKIIRRAGRPDMHLGLLSTASSLGAIMACMRPGLREPHNTQIGIHIMPEQKINWSRLILAKFCEDWGITPWTSCVSVTGGFCRNAADTAVALVANLLGQLCYGHGSLASLFANRMAGTWGDEETQWAVSAACRASERNIRVPIGGVSAANTETGGTEAGLYQATAMAILNTASGFSYAWIAGGSGREARLIGDVMNAVAGMKRDNANELLKRIRSVADAKAQKQTSGLIEFPQIYDLDTAQPKPEFEALCQQVQEGLAKLGVPFS